MGCDWGQNRVYIIAHFRFAGIGDSGFRAGLLKRVEFRVLMVYGC